MPGGIAQLLYYGPQNLAISGNPELTYFRAAYRRHTNFSKQLYEQAFNGIPGFGKTVSATINKNGDLLSRGFLRVVLPEVTPTSGKNFRWLNWVGHVLIKNYSLEIGGKEIDKQTGEWLHIWNAMTQKSGQQTNYARLVGNVPKLVQPSTSSKPETILYIPLQFFFCQHPGLSLPLIALQHQEIKINFTFRNKLDCYWSENGVETNLEDFSATLCFEYIFLDVEERALFAKNKMQYLITQIQTSGDETILSTSEQIKLKFTNISKSLLWVIQKDDHVNRDLTQNIGGQQWFNYTDKIDTTNFSGTPTPSLGYGIGTAASLTNYQFNSMPITGGADVSDTGILGSSNLYAPDILQNSNTNDVDLNDLSFQDLFGNTSNPSGLSAELPIFDSGENPARLIKITFNNQDREVERDSVYYNHVQHLDYPNWGGVGLNVYNFALNPHKFEPSGVCNFSAIDNSTLHLTLTNNTLLKEDGTTATTAKCRIYSINYNLLRIQGGMGALAYGY